MNVEELDFNPLSQPPVSSEHYLDEQAWIRLDKHKKAFQDNGAFPDLDGIVRPLVLNSWIRCRDINIDPAKSELKRTVSDKQINQVLEQNRLLIELVSPLLKIIKDLHLDTECLVELIDPNGISLVQYGNTDIHTHVSTKSIYDESTMGTNAHTLCMLHKRAIKLMGPEHYCNALTNLAACAAPILNTENDVIASILFTQPLPDEPWHGDYQKMLSHTLGFIASLASTLDFQLRYLHSDELLKGKNAQLDVTRSYSKRNRNMLDAAVRSSTEMIFLLDELGCIQQASPAVGRAIKMSPEDVIGYSVDELTSEIKQSQIVKIAQTHEHINIKLYGVNYDLYAKKVAKFDQTELDGHIVKLIPDRSSKSKQVASNIGDAATIRFEDILGNSPLILQTKKRAERFAMTPENILITGESGTGKEYFAQAIHNKSFPGAPFMSINCAAIPPRLIESELFGYEGGSFTGAEKGGKPGKIELADGGTLFLDEIGDMPLELQATLLRVLENKRVMRLGGKAYKQVSFRVMAATNRDLFAMVENNEFREDLFYRLTLLTLELPALRDHPEDIMFFARYFLNESKCKGFNGPSNFAEELSELLVNYEWPGNIRQLKNAIFSAYFAAQGDLITVDDLPLYLKQRFSKKIESAQNYNLGRPQDDPLVIEVRHQKTGGLSIQNIEKTAINDALVRSNHNICQAAKELRISRATMYRKLKKYQMM